jgi:predicted GNAT family acetyltransferase
MAHEVTRNDTRGRYELVVDGQLVGIADFHDDGETVVLPHTEIAAERRGHGMGALLVEGVLADVRARGRVVVPQCWYVREYLDQHPDDADLLARRS